MLQTPGLVLNKRLQSYISARVSFLEPEGQQALIERWGHTFQLERGDRLENNGGETRIYFIEEGCVKLASETENRELVYAFGWEGQCVYNLPRYLSELHEDTYLEAVRKSKLLAIGKKDFQELLDRFPELYRFWKENMELNLLERFEREDLLLHARPQERLSKLLLREPDILKKVPQVHVAAYLGMRPETLNRLLHLDLNQGEE